MQFSKIYSKVKRGLGNTDNKLLNSKEYIWCLNINSICQVHVTQTKSKTIYWNLL